ncbi:hypothetical protein COH20_001381 [Aspergillus flavus]|uniref:Unnamed protein product n=1 Tax=Aspergillus oryzae TaxID=5062 RepID=A0AAN4YYX8_ASPOZ|nr:hypothetical protein NYO67_10532 [Aspergillus flavus]RAQ70751.1 hypothetical protein COH20_001381 [Aspergillus flavus]GMF74921.1 unnamed protein product [Aspergillus oryzae]GMG10937.1 unnamed protein product [Aspergillus oryzae]GMG36471.1 unnamed protein product [Aspergillus oryzae]
MKLTAAIVLSLSTLALTAPAGVPSKNAHKDPGHNFYQEASKSLLGNVGKALKLGVRTSLLISNPLEWKLIRLDMTAQDQRLDVPRQMDTILILIQRRPSRRIQGLNTKL